MGHTLVIGPTSAVKSAPAELLMLWACGHPGATVSVAQDDVQTVVGPNDRIKSAQELGVYLALTRPRRKRVVVRRMRTWSDSDPSGNVNQFRGHIDAEI